MNYKEKKCKECGAIFKQYNSLNSYCSPVCKGKNTKPKEFKPKCPIKKQSDKRKAEQQVYDLKRKIFLAKPENKHCVIQGTYCTGIATTIEHSAGKLGYYDDWARDNKISLFIDERFFKPACLNCNLELENNPELSRKHQLSKIHGGEKL